MKRIIASKVINIADINTYYFDQKLSAKEVGKKFNLSEWQIYKFMKKNSLPRRTSSITAKFSFLKSPLSFKKKTHLNKTDYQLYLAGLMLYLAEGYKIGNHLIDLANSNPKLLKIFLNFLKNIYQVNPNKIRAYIYRFPANLNHYL